MIEGGKVDYNGSRAKPARPVEVGAIIKLLQGNTRKEVVVLGISDTRGPAKEAQLLYKETEESIKRREEIARMKEKNIVVEILRKLMAEQIAIYKRTNVVQATNFSEKITLLMNTYYNGLITNEEVIKELLKTAEEINALRKEGEKLGLSEEELAFYDALTKPQAIKDFYEHDELIAITKELTDLLRKNRTIDWQKKESARAGMRRLVKRLLKKHKYPPEGMEDAVQTVMSQCEMWSDQLDM